MVKARLSHLEVVRRSMGLSIELVSILLFFGRGLLRGGELRGKSLMSWLVSWLVLYGMKGVKEKKGLEGGERRRSQELTIRNTLKHITNIHIHNSLSWRSSKKFPRLNIMKLQSTIRILKNQSKKTKPKYQLAFIIHTN